MVHGVALDRDALYYPYVHIKDVNWLKATLLCFPNVRRMVPLNYQPNDSEEIKEFCQIAGPRGEALLTNVNLFSEAATEAEQYLLTELVQNDGFIRSKYSRRKTSEEIGPATGQFRLHDEKIVPELYSYLMEGGPNDSLAWWAEHPDDRPDRHGRGHWLALHPTLGSAILAIKAIAIAEDLGLDIVTDSSSVHHAVVSKRKKDIFNELIGEPTPNQPPTIDDTVDDLAEVVLSTNFDVSKLSAKQIAELLADGKDLRRFKEALMPVAATIPAIRDSMEREKRLQAAAADVIAEWERYKKSLPPFALDAIVGAGEVKWPELATTLLQGGVAWRIAGGVGLGIAVVSYAGFKVWRGYKEKKSSPYSYLSRIASAQAKNQTLLTLPPLAEPSHDGQFSLF
ncbi:MAG: hypothetical protein WA628_07550 [Terriglobales bacterium]